MFHVKHRNTIKKREHIPIKSSVQADRFMQVPVPRDDMSSLILEKSQIVKSVKGI